MPRKATPTAVAALRNAFNLIPPDERPAALKALFCTLTEEQQLAFVLRTQSEIPIVGQHFNKMADRQTDILGRLNDRMIEFAVRQEQLRHNRSSELHARWRQLKAQGKTLTQIQKTTLQEFNKSVTIRAITKVVNGK